MYLEERRKKIVEIVNENDAVTVEEFSKRFNVSLATIRSDLKYLDKTKQLTRTHGGAIPLVKNPKQEQELLTGFTQRKEKNISEKISIAKTAIHYIEDGDSIILDASSTCYELARLLKDTTKKITVITNGIRTGNLLKMNINITVILIGGVLTGDSNSTKSLIGAEILNSINIDKIFFSAFALSFENGFSDKDIFEIELKKKMLSKTQIRYALIDSSKFDNISLSYFLPLEEVTSIITDSGIKHNRFKEYSKKTPIILAN